LSFPDFLAEVVFFAEPFADTFSLEATDCYDGKGWPRVWIVSGCYNCSYPCVWGEMGIDSFFVTFLRIETTSWAFWKEAPLYLWPVFELN
jgi:hypothetical protein